MKGSCPPLVIRADATPQVGVGHLMRCLALAQAWRGGGGQVTFLSECESEGPRMRIVESGARLLMLSEEQGGRADLERTMELLGRTPGAWLVLDGYGFEPAYQRSVVESGHPLLVIDDIAHQNHYHADVLLNQNVGAHRLTYSCEPHAVRLLGTRYAMVQQEFLARPRHLRSTEGSSMRVLVTLGGGDVDEGTRKVLRALRQLGLPDLAVVAVLGDGPSQAMEVEASPEEPDARVHVARDVRDMAALMAWADVAVSGGGSTCWELAFMGVPNVILVLAENQRAVAESLHEYGVGVNLGWLSSVDEGELAQTVAELLRDRERRRAMGERGQRLIDGSGAARVAKTLRAVTKWRR